MGIDGIGQGGGTPKVGPGPASISGPESDKFELLPESVERSGGAELLDQVQRGEIRLDAYLDVRVANAVGHLEGKLSPEQLEFVKDELREQLRSDPVLIELVRRATGQSPETQDA
jgi:hypothetical protein